MVIIAIIINDVSFTAALVFDENYQLAWSYKGCCEI